MAQKLYTESYIEAIADAIRENISSQDTFTVSEMADEIEEIGGDCYDGQWCACIQSTSDST